MAVEAKTVKDLETARTLPGAPPSCYAMDRAESRWIDGS